MTEALHLKIISPSAVVVDAHVPSANIPGLEGDFGVLPGHAPLLAQIGTGNLVYTSQGRPRHMAVDGGWVEVLGDHVRVLVNTAERADEIDLARAEESLKRARDRLTNPQAGLDVARALNALKRAQARLDAAKQK